MSGYHLSAKRHPFACSCYRCVSTKASGLLFAVWRRVGTNDVNHMMIVRIHRERWFYKPMVVFRYIYKLASRDVF